MGVSFYKPRWFALSWPSWTENMNEAKLLNHFLSLTNNRCQPWKASPSPSQVRRELISWAATGTQQFLPGLWSLPEKISKTEWEDFIPWMVPWVALKGICGGTRWSAFSPSLCCRIFCALVKHLCFSLVLLYFKQVASPLKRTWPLISHVNAKHPRVKEACVGWGLKAWVTILIIGPTWANVKKLPIISDNNWSKPRNSWYTLSNPLIVHSLKTLSPHRPGDDSLPFHLIISPQQKLPCTSLASCRICLLLSLLLSNHF